MGLTFYDQGALTIDGVSAPVTDVSVSFDDDARPAIPTPIMTPLRMTWPQWLLVGYAGDSAHVPIFEHDTRETLERRIAEAVRGLRVAAVWNNIKNRCAGWRWRRAKRHEKAKARREKMRSARYAARWEQAHLRGEK